MSNPIMSRASLDPARMLKTEVVDVPELGEQMIMRQLSEAGRQQYLAARAALPGDEEAKGSRSIAVLLTMVWVDETGALVLTNGDADCDLLLTAMPTALLVRLGNRAAEICGFTAQAAAEAKKN